MHGADRGRFRVRVHEVVEAVDQPAYTVFAPDELVGGGSGIVHGRQLHGRVPGCPPPGRRAPGGPPPGRRAPSDPPCALPAGTPPAGSPPRRVAVCEPVTAPVPVRSTPDGS